MADYTFRDQSITTDPQTITIANLSASLEGRTIPSLSTAPVIIPIPKADRPFYITNVTTTTFVIDPSDIGVDLPVNVDFIVRTFDQVSSVSNANSSTVSRIRRLLQITGTNEFLTDAEIQERIDDALEQFSRDKPRIGRFEYIGNGEQEFPLGTGWADEFSVMRNVEYPAGNQPPDYVDGNDFFTETVDTSNRTIDNASAAATSVTLSTAADAGYFKSGEIITIGDDDASETNWCSADGNTTTGVVTVKNALANTYDATPFIRKLNHLKFRVDSPSSSETFVQEYTLPHTHTDTTDTIPGTDYEPFTWLAASLCAWSIAAQMAKTQHASINEDLIDNLAKVTVYRDLAVDLRNQYDKKMGVDEESGQKAVLSFIDEDVFFQHGTEYLLHGRRFI